MLTTQRPDEPCLLDQLIRMVSLGVPFRREGLVSRANLHLLGSVSSLLALTGLI